MGIEIKGITHEYTHVPEEDYILREFIKTLDYPNEDFKIVKPSQNYTTLKYKDYDLIRLKYTDITKWLEVPVIKDMKKKYIGDPLFEEKTKKNIFWKSFLNDTDLSAYKEIIDYFIVKIVNK